MGKKIKIVRRHEDLPKPTYVHAMNEVYGKPARAAAIAGTAFLDLLLRGALERRMRQNTEFLDGLFENRGPLQEFSARIKLAFALEIIGSGAYLDLLILRDIRNAFAHAAEAIDFNRNDVAALCKSLWYPTTIAYADKPKPSTPEQFFIRGVEMIADGLIELEMRDLGRQRTPLDGVFIKMGPRWPTPRTPQASPEKPRTPPGQGRRAQRKKSSEGG